MVAGIHLRLLQPPLASGEHMCRDEHVAQVAAPKALCCTQGCIMAVVAVASMLNLCCAGILLNDGSAACAWQVNRLKADFEER